MNSHLVLPVVDILSVKAYGGNETDVLGRLGSDGHLVVLVGEINLHVDLVTLDRREII